MVVGHYREVPRRVNGPVAVDRSRASRDGCARFHDRRLTQFKVCSSFLCRWLVGEDGRVEGWLRRELVGLVVGVLPFVSCRLLKFGHFGRVICAKNRYRFHREAAVGLRLIRVGRASIRVANGMCFLSLPHLYRLDVCFLRLLVDRARVATRR